MMHRLKLQPLLRRCVMHLILTVAFTHTVMALQLPRQQSRPYAQQQKWRCPNSQKDKTEEAKIIEQQLDLLIHSKKGMLVFHSQADLARAFDLMANYPSPAMTSAANSTQSQVLPVVTYLEKTNKGFKSLFSSPFGLPEAWQSFPVLAALLNEDQALIVRDDVYAFNGPEQLYRMPESQRKSYQVLRNRRFSEKLPDGSAFCDLGPIHRMKEHKAHLTEGTRFVAVSNGDDSNSADLSGQSRPKREEWFLLGFISGICFLITIILLLP